MTSSNHALTGAVIALSLQQPLLALPLAFVSHFALDALPHFGVSEESLTRNRLWFMRLFWPLDALILLALFAYVLFNAGWGINIPIVFASMFLATSPDLAWIYRFALKEKWGKLSRPPMNAFNRFHANIQWGERPWGIVIELVWFILMFMVLTKQLA